MLQALIGPVAGLLDKFIEDKDQKASWPTRLPPWLNAICTKQTWGKSKSIRQRRHIEVYLSLAGVLLGWCLFCHGVALRLRPAAMFVCSYMGVEIPELPTFDMDSLMTVLLGMLGLGGSRTVEKVKGITK